MKAYFVLILLLFTPFGHAEEPKTFIGSFSSSRLSNYKPKSECKEEYYLACGDWMIGHYIYTLKPISTSKAPRKISIAMESHTLRIYKSNNLWLVKVKDLEPFLAKKTGAKYELVSYALINGDSCSETSLLNTAWLYPSDMRLEEFRDERGDFCYKSKKD